MVQIRGDYNRERPVLTRENCESGFAVDLCNFAALLWEWYRLDCACRFAISEKAYIWHDIVLEREMGRFYVSRVRSQQDCHK